tara:strand:- start:20 stop:307 length:288 start_codon:yes stop_codon:yes gene_type:complete
MINKLVDKKLVPLSTEELEEYNQRLANAPSEFDMAMEDLRAKRNNLLKETDHYALSDQTLSDDMRTYRQSLRDITNGLTTVEDVNSVTWPTKPGA